MPSGMSSVAATRSGPPHSGPPRSSKFCEGIWGKGRSRSEQEQYAPFDSCGHDDTSLELQLGQVMNF